jgi:hypothetical protein
LSHAQKVALLKEYLVLLFHTVMPPDVKLLVPPSPSHRSLLRSGVLSPTRLWQRVGIVRKLKWGVSLKKDAPGAYRLDMTTQRFKNSRFYGERPI